MKVVYDSKVQNDKIGEFVNYMIAYVYYLIVQICLILSYTV